MPELEMAMEKLGGHLVNIAAFLIGVAIAWRVFKRKKEPETVVDENSE